MKVAKTSSVSGVKSSLKKSGEQYQNDLDKDIENLVLFTQGRVRFGTGVDGARGENISGEFQVFTTSATPNAENTLAHGLGAIPIGRIVLWQDKAGSLYQGPATGTAWTASNVYLKCDVASVTFSIFLLK